VLRELVMYDLDTQIYRRLNSTLDYADSFRSDRLYLDPHSYLYRHIVNFRPKMEIRVQESYPPQDTLIGISSWGKVFSGSPQDQLRQEVSRLTGMRVPSYPEISGIFVDGYAHPFHMFTNHKIVDLRETVHVCLVCAETIDFKKVFADDGLLSNGQEFFSRVLCKACSSMAVHWEKKDLFQVVNFTGLRPLLLTTVKEENGLFQADYLPVETAYQQVYPRRTYRYKKDAMTEAYSIQLKKLVENMSNGIISPMVISDLSKSKLLWAYSMYKLNKSDFINDFQVQKYSRMLHPYIRDQLLTLKEKNDNRIAMDKYVIFQPVLEKLLLKEKIGVVSLKRIK